MVDIVSTMLYLYEISMLLEKNNDEPPHSTWDDEFEIIENTCILAYYDTKIGEVMRVELLLHLKNKKVVVVVQKEQGWTLQVHVPVAS